LPAGRPLRLECQIKAFQIMTVDKSRLGDYKGRLDASQIMALEDAMREAWGL
jgi:mRNA-degrading endonuclease toxin of MazEF toxin-antitoxin module